MKKNLKSKKNNNNKIAIIFSFVIILIFGFLFYNFILKQNDIEESQSQISSNSESATTQVTDTTFTMTAIGDVMCHNTQYWDAYNKESDTYDFSYVFKNISHYIQNSDISIGNLETSFAGKDRGYSNYPTFNSPDALAYNLKDMGLDIISTDEIGNKKDIDAIKEASLSGVALIFTMHASSVYDLYKREDILKLIDERIFDCIIVLSNKGGIGTIADIKIIDKEEKINACI